MFLKLSDGSYFPSSVTESRIDFKWKSKYERGQRSGINTIRTTPDPTTPKQCDKHTDPNQYTLHPDIWMIF